MTAAPAGGGLAEVLGMPELPLHFTMVEVRARGERLRPVYTAAQMHEYAVNYLRSHGEAIAALPALWRQRAEMMRAMKGGRNYRVQGAGVVAAAHIDDCADELDAALAKVASNGRGE